MEELNYKELSKIAGQNKDRKEERFKDGSKNRLLKIAKKKIQTTMIGALSSLESHFGFLWEHPDGEELTPEKEHLHSLYEEARSEILDRGNNQMRNLEAEFSHYDITWLRYNLTLPVRPMDTKENEDG